MFFALIYLLTESWNIHSVVEKNRYSQNDSCSFSIRVFIRSKNVEFLIRKRKLLHIYQICILSVQQNINPWYIFIFETRTVNQQLMDDIASNRSKQYQEKKNNYCHCSCSRTYNTSKFFSFPTLTSIREHTNCSILKPNLM